VKPVMHAPAAQATLPVALDVGNPCLHDLVDSRAGLELLAGGFQFLEGPVWLARQQALVFSDIPGNCLYRWQDGRGVTILRASSHMANGNTCDSLGRLLTCEHATSRVTRTEPDGRVRVIASHYDGRELNSPNDIVVRSDGCVYFTDPNFGRRPTRVGVPRPQQQPCQAVYRWDPMTENLERVAGDFDQPNGLCFSLDERCLLVNDSPRGHIRIFEVLPDGRLRGGRVWAEVRADGPGVPDGMKVDEQGNVWCAGPGGLHVFDPAGRFLGRVRLPEQAANFAWGEADGLSLFVTASASLYRLRTYVRSR
jgi:gluconolactonase